MIDIGTFILFLLAQFVTVSSDQLHQNFDLQPGLEALSVSDVLRDGQGDFDPWNQDRWKDWYDERGRILRPFLLDTSISFIAYDRPWELVFSDEFQGRFLLIVGRQGLQIDGNGIIMDARTEQQKLPLPQLFALKKSAWSGGGTCEIGGIFYQLPIKDGIPPSVITNFTFMGLKRGIKISGTGDLEGHRLIVEDCLFARNRVGFYTNGYNAILQNCELIENGYGGIYSGSGSRRNQFVANVFRDNTLSQHQPSYGDFIGDTFFDSEIRLNRFIRSQIDNNFRRIGISMFRNMGEGGRLRKHMPHGNVIRANFFDGYSVAIHIGARMGRKTRNDVSHEGRDYAFYNIVDSNTISNSEIGIKINTEGNTLQSNKFENVQKGIVLQCVYYELKNTTIADQDDSTIDLWYTLDDYVEYAEWFRFQDDLNQGILKEEKLIEIHTEHPVLARMESEQIRLNPSLMNDENVLNSPRFGSPSLVCKGNFSGDLGGEEYVATWDRPISTVEGTDYFTILILDQNGTEINRTARSLSRWNQIATGYFTKDFGDGEMQIAAVSDEPANGKYPVYIFNRGYMEPDTIMLRDNTNSGIKISRDSDYGLSVEFDGGPDRGK